MVAPLALTDTILAVFVGVREIAIQRAVWETGVVQEILVAGWDRAVEAVIYRKPVAVLTGGIADPAGVVVGGVWEVMGGADGKTVLVVEVFQGGSWVTARAVICSKPVTVETVSITPSAFVVVSSVKVVPIWTLIETLGVVEILFISRLVTGDTVGRGESVTIEAVGVTGFAFVVIRDIMEVLGRTLIETLGVVKVLVI